MLAFELQATVNPLKQTYATLYVARANVEKKNGSVCGQHAMQYTEWRISIC